MKRIWIAALLFALAVPCVVAQDDAPRVEVDPDIKLMALYDTAGRSWSHRVIHWSRGESPYVVRMHAVVDSLEDERAQVTTTHSDDWGTDNETTETYELTNVPDGLKSWAGKNLAVETLDMGFRKFECRKHVSEEDGVRVTTWVSTEFHPLMVKQTVFGATDYTVCKLTSFNDGKVDPYLLYRKSGRSWTIELAGGMKMKSTITGVTEEHANMQTELFKADGTSLAPATETQIKFQIVESAPEEMPDPAVPTEKKVNCQAGEFDCISYDNGDTWVLKQYPGVIAKGPAMELVEFDLGHDSNAFYRTVGNSYTLESTTKVAGVSVNQSMKYEVTKIDGANCTYTMKSIDDNGAVMSNTKMNHTLPDAPEEGEAPPPTCPYTDQIEELVYTPAGTFPAIRTDAGEMVMWTWNGLTIRIEMKTDDVEMVQELAQLNIQ
ncbi:MAG: hypothetical protein K8I27_05530 [Planctomycetes bacterium]|nr:hypothetical protein [Planctomycetota bacterium]